MKNKKYQIIKDSFSFTEQSFKETILFDNMSFFEAQLRFNNLIEEHYQTTSWEIFKSKNGYSLRDSPLQQIPLMLNYHIIISDTESFKMVEVDGLPLAVQLDTLLPKPKEKIIYKYDWHTFLIIFLIGLIIGRII